MEYLEIMVAWNPTPSDPLHGGIVQPSTDLPAVHPVHGIFLLSMVWMHLFLLIMIMAILMRMIS